MYPSAYLAALILATALSGPDGAASLDAEFRKCGGGAIQPVLWIDGQATERSFDTVRDLEVAAFHVLCWNAEEGIFQRGTGDPVGYLLTRPFMDGIEADLAGIARAQERYFAETGGFAPSPESLALEELTPGLTVRIDVAGAGWSAVATLDPVVHVCQVAGGAATTLPEGTADDGPGSPGEPSCALDARLGRE